MEYLQALVCQSGYALRLQPIPAESSFYDLCAGKHTSDVALMTLDIKGCIMALACQRRMWFISAVMRQERRWRMQQPYCPDLAQRSLDSHPFKSAVRHFSFAYTDRFAPSHPLPRLSLSAGFGVLSSCHITYSLLLRGGITHGSPRKRRKSCYIVKTPPLNGMKTSVSKSLKR